MFFNQSKFILFIGSVVVTIFRDSVHQYARDCRIDGRKPHTHEAFYGKPLPVAPLGSAQIGVRDIKFTIVYFLLLQLK